MTDDQKSPCEKYESFPLRIVILRALMITAWFVTGILLMLRLSRGLAVGFIVFGVLLLLSMMAFACRYCAYRGKLCDNGISKLTSVFFKSSVNKEKFAVNSRKLFIPLYVLVLIPLVGGLILALSQSNPITLFMVHVILLGIIITTSPLLACKHCLMSDVCPYCMLRK